MTREEYMAKRNELMGKAQGQIDSGELEGSEATMDEVRELDAKWDAICLAQANADALAGAARPINIQTGLAPAPGEADRAGEPEAATAKSEAYRTAWALTMMGRGMNPEQRRVFDMVNEAYTHTTGNTSIIIPETVASGIWEMAGELYPYWDDISKTFVNGTLKLIKEDSSTGAGWYEEETPTGDAKEAFAELALNGCELARAITVSWKLREMAIDEFIPYIQRKLAKKMGAALGYGATHGAGAVQGKPAEPTGVVTALKAEAGTPQIVAYAQGSLTYKDLTAARAKVKSGYGAGLKIYANSNTIWGEIANVADANKRPLFIANVMQGGVGNVLGMVVKEDDSMLDGEILLSNPAEGYAANINKQMSITTEEHGKARTADYCAYAIVDGAAITNKAHALLERKATA